MRYCINSNWAYKIGLPNIAKLLTGARAYAERPPASNHYMNIKT